MKILTWKVVLFSTFFMNFTVLLYMWWHLDSRCQCHDGGRLTSRVYRKSYVVHEIGNSSLTDSEKVSEVVYKRIMESVTVLLRDFEFFESDIIETLKSFLKIFHRIKVLIIADKLPYPPLELAKHFPGSDIHCISLQPSVEHPANWSNPHTLLNTDYVIFLPDSVRMNGAFQLTRIIKQHYLFPNHIIAVPVIGERTKCFSLNVRLRSWTIEYKEDLLETECDAVYGNHVLFLRRDILLQLSHPFARPFPQSLFIQTALRKIKIHVMKDHFFQQGLTLFLDPHNKWKHHTLETKRREQLYRDLGIKKVILPNRDVEWYGCSKNTPRCFGTVINDVPEYLFHGRWTPPCCLENLRETARHVFGILEKCGVRYWLEGGSLLGAARNGDIILWDYDVDIGMYKEDIKKCEWLKNAEKQSIIDSQGFVWEKAREGDFTRVQFSQSNHLHVDIFPFYSRNGIMTKDTWFPSHRQDMEFPERYLIPLSKIKFVGVLASAPNNIKDFLELKFGKGVIENPQYPVPEVLAITNSV